MAGKLAASYLAHYSASKFAVVGFTQGLALELAEHGINVNCVCPAFVKTAMQDREVQWEAELRGMTPEEVRAGYVKMTPLGRLGTPDDVSKVVRFLASSDAEFMTGQAVNVTGGALLH
jgi:meso-butanediol dehydrogenase/(S,S)-butanediol dehydrogenase/diacetyl reductase